jgi:hypothetical protein
MAARSEDAPRKHSVRRRPFEIQEDALIMRMMLGGGGHSWDSIARRLAGRTPRQCRERWTKYLSPSVRLDPWTEAEDRLLLEKVNEVRFAWSAIASAFNGRSDNDIKNRWYSHLKYETVLEGNKYVMSSNATMDRRRRHCVKTSPKANALRLLDAQHRMRRLPVPMIPVPEQLPTEKPLEAEFEDLWDRDFFDEDPNN